MHGLPHEAAASQGPPTFGCVQMRALNTYVQRVYFPFLLAEPVQRSGAASTCLLWPHTPFLGPEEPGKGAALGCMAVMATLDSLPQALLDLTKAASSARALLTMFAASYAAQQQRSASCGPTRPSWAPRSPARGPPWGAWL